LFESLQSVIMLVCTGEGIYLLCS